MSIVKSEAIVTKGFRYGEASKIITLYTRDFGKFNALVKSARSVKSRSSGVFDNINHVSIIFNKKDTSDLQFISKGECINSFSKIKSDLDKLSSAFRIIELVNHATHDYDNNEDIFDLLSTCLFRLNECERNKGNYLLYFQANLTKHMGIKPELVDDNPLPGRGAAETFNSLNALKLSRKEYPIVNSLFERDLDFTGNMVLDDRDAERIGNKFDHYLSSHLEKFGYLKTKNILHELKS